MTMNWNISKTNLIEKGEKHLHRIHCCQNAFTQDLSLNHCVILLLTKSLFKNSLCNLFVSVQLVQTLQSFIALSSVCSSGCSDFVTCIDFVQICMFAGSFKQICININGYVLSLCH